MTDELTLEDLEDSVVGKTVPIMIDWISNGVLTYKTVKVEIAEPTVAEKITQKYTRRDRAGKPQKLSDEQEKRYQAELFQRFLKSPDLTGLSHDAILDKVIAKIPIMPRMTIQNTILGDLSEVMTLEEDALKNLGMEEPQDTSSSDSQPSTSDSS